MSSVDVPPSTARAHATRADLDASLTPVRPFRRLQLTVESPPELVGRRLLVLQYDGDEEVANDRFTLQEGTNHLQVLTASRARGCAVRLDDVDEELTQGRLPVGLRASIEDLGERPIIDGHLFLLGAMKSGTSTLYASLRQHPAIAANRLRKEPAFFSSGAVYRGHYEYASQYRFDPVRHRWAIDGSTNYSKRSRFPGVPERLAQLPGQLRFLYLMRDPVARVESHMAHNVGKGRWGLEQVDHHLEECVDVSRYSEQLDRYAEVFPDLRDRLLLIDFRDVVEDLPGTLRRIESFLDIAPHEYRQRPPSNLRSTSHGADTVALSDAQTQQAWELLRDEPRRLAERYDFVPREPWGPR